ncbi:MAG: diaminopimelate decarboxylase [Ignavibacteriae bacterium]|nr:diaminopimelate decarboxylase [Ignavibacteriota bacterium]
MDYFKSEYFTYKNDKLFCENVSLENIAEEVDTPVYVYSKKFFLDKYLEFQDAFKSIKHKIFYASKANFNINVTKLFHDFGAGVDVNSAGEFYKALKAGVAPENMLLTGVGKTDEEIKLGLENNVKLIKAESLEEIFVINKIAKELGKVAPLAIRVNPNVDPVTHPYISTGLAENKFGIDETVALEIFREVSKLSNIKLVGIDMHIGSQITTVQPYVEAITKLVDIEQALKQEGIELEHIDVGGGVGVYYKDEKPFTPKEFADAILPVLERTDCEIFFEPGRFLTANGGCLVSKVLYTKSNLDKNFLVVDASMTDLLRPSIYKAYHHIQPIEKTNNNDITADIVGPVCESGDFLGKNRTMTECRRDDLIAVMSSGAYGMVMSSNYNARRRPAEVLVDGDKFFVIRERETFEQLFQNETLL